MADTDFDPFDFDDYDEDGEFKLSADPEGEDFDSEEVTDLEQMWEYDDYFDYEVIEYEFHGTGDTGSAS
jgi:hypothetical protein